MACVFRWPRGTKTGRRPGKIPKGLPAVASRAQRIRAVDRRGPRVGKGFPDRHDASVYAAPSTGAGKHHSRLVSPLKKTVCTGNPVFAKYKVCNLLVLCVFDDLPTDFRTCSIKHLSQTSVHWPRPHQGHNGQTLLVRLPTKDLNG